MSNKVDLYIIGAGDAGGYLAHHIEEWNGYVLKGFLDDDDAKAGQSFYGFPLIGKIDMLFSLNHPVAIAIAIANPIVRKKILDKLQQLPNIVYPSFIHPQAWRGKEVKIGRGCIIYPGTTINYETEIGDFVIINMNAAIGHNCSLGKFTTLSPGVNLGGFTNIGACSLIGIGASTLQGTTVGKVVTVGGMTMVLKNIPDGATVVGNPGKIIKQVKLD